VWYTRPLVRTEAKPETPKGRRLIVEEELRILEKSGLDGFRLREDARGRKHSTPAETRS
jgi:hypothetical protein